jgi:spore coat protein CotH
MTSDKNFKNRHPQSQRKKEFFALIIIALLIISTIFIYTYIKNSPAIPSKYPKINIICNEEIRFDHSINCTFELESEDLDEIIVPINAKIRRRGATHGMGVDRWPKKGYRLELSQQKSLLGMRKDDDWYLFAMYNDYPRMRIKLCMEIWRSLEPTNPTAILPDSKYVCVYLNGEFNGLYLLTEKNDRRLFGLDNAINNLNSSLIIQAKNPNSFRKYYHNDWEQDWPNEDENIYIMDNIMNNLYSFVNNASDEEFFDANTGIYSKFDKLNLIDFFVYNFFICHKDFWSKNYYIVRNTYPSKFYLIPWDFDRSLGQSRWRSHDADDNIEADICEKNELYNRLICNEEFMQDCKDRWAQLRQELWTNDFILDMMLDIYDEIEDILEIETKMWNPSIYYENWENDVDESVNELFEWVPDRIEFCDSYFEY